MCEELKKFEINEQYKIYDLERNALLIMEGKEFNINRIMWKIALAWRLMLVYGIVFAIVVPYLAYGWDKYSYNKSVENIEANVQSELKTLIQEQTQGYDYDSLTEEEIEAVEVAQHYRDQVEILKQYRDDSPIFSLDPYNVPSIALVYYVDVKYTAADEYEAQDLSAIIEAKANSILSMYKRYLNTDTFVAAIMKDQNVSIATSYARDLISYSTDADTLYVEIMLTEEMDAQQMISFVDELIQAQKSNFDDICDFDITRKISDISYKRKSGVSDKKVELDDQIQTAEDSLNALLAKLTSEQLYFYNDESVTAEEITAAYDVEGKVATAKAELSTPRFKKIYYVIGFIFGIVLMMMYVFAKEIISQKLTNASDIEGIYKLNLIGVIERMDKRRHKTPIDRLLIRLRDKRRIISTPQEKLDMAVASIAIKCEKLGISELCITGSAINKLDDETKSKLRSGFNASKLKVNMLDEIVYDSKSLETCVKCGNAVVIETVNRSLYSEITKEINKAKEYGVNILGSVVVEG